MSQPSSAPSPTAAGSRLDARFVAYSRGAALATLVVTGIAALGWLLWVPALASMAPGHQTIRVDGVIAFTLAAVALHLRLARGSGATVSRLAATGAAVLGLLAFITHTTGADFGLNRLFPVTTLELRSGPHPSRMAPVSAVLLLLLGGGLMLPPHRSILRRITQLCATAALAMAVFVAIGLAFGLFDVALVGPFRNISIPAALATLLLATGMLSAHPADPPMSIFAADAAGGMVARRLLPWAVIVPFILGWAFLAARRSGPADDAVGVAALVVANIAVLVLLILRNAADLTAYDQARERASEALRLSELRFRTALEASAIMVFTHDRDLRYTWVHSRDPDLEEAALLGFRDRDLLDDPAEAAAVESFKRRVLESGTGARREFRLTLRHDTRDFDVRADPLRDAAGTIVGLTCAAVDITEHRRAEEALRHTQKLESLGVLAGGIAHDFNNLLTGILGNASLAARGLATGEPPATVVPLLNDVISASERAADLTRQLLAYAGKGQFVVAPVDLGTLVTELVPLLRASIARSVRLALNVAPGLPPVEADASQLQQLVMNLVINAAEAIGEEDGTVAVTVFESEDGPDRPVVTLEVRDTGAGMDDGTLERIFDPFFTTKFLGRGLGLAAAQGIVRAHHGTIDVQSRRGEGTTFTVALPAVRAADLPAPAAPFSRPSGARPRVSGSALRPSLPRGTVLVVEDEAVVRALARAALEDAGYRVLEAEHGEQALELVGTHAEEIVVVLLDANMPVLNGAETAARLHELHPALPIVVSSGYGESDTLPRFGGSARHFLQKPYHAQDLVAAIDAAAS